MTIDGAASVTTDSAADEIAASAPEPEHVAQWRRDGYAVVRGVFRPDEVADLAAAFERLRDRGLEHGRSFRHGNLCWRIGRDAALGPVVRFVQWPSYVDAVLDGFRTDPRLLAILRPLIGADLKQIINQMHWKPPGAAMTEFGWHQDIRFRRPRTAYREPGVSYVQTGIAVDPHRPENGAMRMIPGSHRLGEMTLGEGRVMDTPLDDDDLRRAGLDPDAARWLEMDPGDVALWHLFTVHGSGPNRAPVDRRLYINGYVRAEMCDRGAWTFRAGAPVPLGEPVLIHYEDLFRRPEPHYLDD